MTTLEQLMQMLAAQNGGGPGLPAPAPSMPIPVRTTAPPNLGMPIQPAQDVPEAPLDQSIIRQYLASAGPAPTPPRQASTLDRIVAAIGGFGAGVQGQGAQYIESLRAPQRQYERNLQDYNDRQSNLRLRGIDAAERDQERRTAAAQRIEDQQYARRLAAESRRLGLADDESRGAEQSASRFLYRTSVPEREMRGTTQRQRAENDTAGKLASLLPGFGVEKLDDQESAPKQHEHAL